MGAGGREGVHIRYSSNNYLSSHTHNILRFLWLLILGQYYDIAVAVMNDVRFAKVNSEDHEGCTALNLAARYSEYLINCSSEFMFPCISKIFHKNFLFLKFKFFWLRKVLSEIGRKRLKSAVIG